MAVIRGSLHKDGVDLTYKCFICDEKSTAFWHGTQTLEVCAQCAIRTLPKLIIDATDYHRQLGSHDAVERLEHTLEEVASAYWRAAFCRATVWAKPYRKIPEEIVKQYSDEEDD